MSAPAGSLRVAVLQAAFGPDRDANIAAVVALATQAADAGAHVILPPELFQGPYFCKTQDEGWFAAARAVDEDPGLRALQDLAATRGVVVAASFFERAGPNYFNSLAMIDADGSRLGVYRKSHIPDGPGYQEKFYFTPGRTGFQAWPTRYGLIGAGVCWDQWFPESARLLALQGAELILYPTAIGAEPHDPGLDTSGPWRRVMQGHAAANAVPVAAANRVGVEDGQRFYGGSFITDAGGAIAAAMDDAETGFALATFDRAALAQARAAWGFFRDRRPELYGPLTA